MDPRARSQALAGDLVSTMSERAVEYFFDVGSPTSYLAWTRLPQIAAETGAEIVWRPMLLGGVFKATGNASPVTVPAKGRWMNDDIRRWADRYGVPFRFNPHFPINTLTLMRGATGLQMRRPDDFARYLELVEQGDVGRAEEPRRPGRARGDARRRRLRRRRVHGAGRRPRGQGAAHRHDRRGGRARRLRCADVLRRRGDVLRPGPARLRSRGAARSG